MSSRSTLPAFISPTRSFNAAVCSCGLDGAAAITFHQILDVALEEDARTTVGLAPILAMLIEGPGHLPGIPEERRREAHVGLFAGVDEEVHVLPVTLGIGQELLAIVEIGGPETNEGHLLLAQQLNRGEAVLGRLALVQHVVSQVAHVETEGAI